MLDKKLKKAGTILIHNGMIHVDGFEADDCMCREVAALAVLWAIGKMQQELVAMIANPGEGNIGMDLPPNVHKALTEINQC